MSPIDALALTAMTGWAVYRQSVRLQVEPAKRFTIPMIYAGVALAVGGFAVPASSPGWALLAATMLLSLVVGLWRGRLTRVWVDGDGRVWRQGTRTTIVLFLALITAKILLGTVAYRWGIDDGAGFGEVLLVVAVMLAAQAELVTRRANRLVSAPRDAAHTRARQTATPATPAV